MNPSDLPATTTRSRRPEGPTREFGSDCYLFGLLLKSQRKPLRPTLADALSRPVPQSLERSLWMWGAAHLLVTMAAVAGLRHLGATGRASLAAGLGALVWWLFMMAMFRIHLSTVRGPDGSVGHRLGIPNGLTTFRLIFAPALALFLVQPGRYGPWAFPILCSLWIVGATDSLDGLLARALRQQTDFGRDLDPLADIVTTTTATVCLAVSGIVPWWFASIIVLRYIGALLGLFLVMGLGWSVVVRSTTLGKVCTPSVQILLFLAAAHSLEPQWPIPSPLLRGLFVVVAILVLLGAADLARTALEGRRAHHA